MLPEKPQQGVLGRHGDMDEQVSILAIIQERGLDLKQVGVKLDQQLASGLVDSLLKFPEQLGHFSRIKIINCKPLMDGGLDGVGHPAKKVPGVDS